MDINESFCCEMYVCLFFRPCKGKCGSHKDTATDLSLITNKCRGLMDITMLLVSSVDWVVFWKTVVSLYCRLQFSRNTPDYTKPFLSRALHSVKGKCFVVMVRKNRCIEERSKKNRTKWPAKTECLGIFSRNPLCLPSTVVVQLSIRKNCCAPKIRCLFVWSPSNHQFKGSSSPSAICCHYNRILDCDAGLGLANTRFPIYIYICVTPTSWSTVFWGSGL